MKYWLDNGLQEIYFFMHMHYEATSPELTVYLVNKMNKQLGLNLIKPTFIQKQNGLFDKPSLMQKAKQVFTFFNSEECQGYKDF